jgi:hypothetical protein
MPVATPTSVTLLFFLLFALREFFLKVLEAHCRDECCCGLRLGE